MSEAVETVAAPPPPVSVRRTLLTATTLLALLCAVAAVVDLSRQERVIAETALTLPADDAAREDPALVRYTPVFEVERPSTLRIELSRGDAEAWVGVSCVLLSEDDGEVRELVVETTRRRSPSGDLTGDRVATASVVALPAGRYSLRLSPLYRALGPPGPPPPPARVRVTVGGRGPFPFFAAAGLIVLPAVVSLVRRARRQRKERRRA